MLLYTAMPLELVLDGIDRKYNFKEIDVDGIKLIIEPIDINHGKIVRLISTNPQDYLNSELSPGKIIEFKI
jgi:hypothetical protein